LSALTVACYPKSKISGFNNVFHVDVPKANSLTGSSKESDFFSPGCKVTPIKPFNSFTGRVTDPTCLAHTIEPLRFLCIYPYSRGRMSPSTHHLSSSVPEASLILLYEKVV
jgi:hypothetical protein